MRVWPWLAAAATGGLLLLAVFVFRGSSEPSRVARGRGDRGPPAERRGDPVAPGRPKQIPGGSTTELDHGDSRLQPTPGTERWHYEEFLRLAAAAPDRFDRLLNEKSNSAAPLQERIALLRAAWKVRGSEALPWFTGAFAEGAGAHEKEADTLRGFVVRYLAAHARADREVREFLRDRVFRDKTVNARDRSVAGRTVLQYADSGEISNLLETIRGTSDATVADGALVGLGLNPHADAASALTWLSGNHPQQLVRERAAEISRQRLTGDVGKEEDE